MNSTDFNISESMVLRRTGLSQEILQKKRGDQGTF